MILKVTKFFKFYLLRKIMEVFFRLVFVLTLVVYYCKGYYKQLPYRSNLVLSQKPIGCIPPNIVVFNENMSLKPGNITDIPVVVKNIPDCFKNHFLQSTKISSHKNYNIKAKMMNDKRTIQSKFIKWVKKVSGQRILYILKFSGDYNSVRTHIDTTMIFPNINYYMLLEGQKDVLIIPKGFERYINMKQGIESVYVNEVDYQNISDMPWLKKLPYYYHFTLNAGSVLVFDNTACAHKFKNMTSGNSSISVRVANLQGQISPLVIKNQATNPLVAKRLANTFVNNGSNSPVDLL